MQVSNTILGGLRFLSNNLDDDIDRECQQQDFCWMRAYRVGIHNVSQEMEYQSEQATMANAAHSTRCSSFCATFCVSTRYNKRLRFHMAKPY